MTWTELLSDSVENKILQEPPPGSRNVKFFMEQWGVSSSTARTRLREMVDRGKLKKVRVTSPNGSAFSYYLINDEAE